MKYLFVILIVFSLLFAGCTQTDPLAGYCGEDEKPIVICETVEEEVLPVDIIIGTPDNETTSEIIVIGDDVEEIIEEEPEIEYAITKEYFEGDFISFADLEVKDPDGDTIDLTFSHPLDGNGEWQTTSGDEGEYTVMITASDGKVDTEMYALIKIMKGNAAPTIDAEETITVLEGEDVVIESTISDEDDDEISVEYSGWMTSTIYTTTYNDAGEHVVTISASDGKHTTTKDVNVIVIHVNRAPILEEVTYDIIALEGELIELVITASDPDGDEVTVSYEEPFVDGTWQTSSGDVGTYSITVIATDGEETVSMEVPVTVQGTNSAPTIEEIADITVDEGEDVVIEVVAFDGDELTTSFSGWMTSATYTTTYDDAGTYTVTVTVSDGEAEASTEVTIIVNDINRPPEFIWG